ncbi:MAG: hypothetical protein LLF94_04140, partial [Chlamydiales bacterium]|nr:hypothetical protein [Chlamydiales bacterium]
GEEYHVKNILEVVNSATYSDDAKVHAASLMGYAKYTTDVKDIIKFLEDVPEQDRATTVQNCKRILAPIIESSANINRAFEVLASQVAEEYLSLVDLMPKDSPQLLMNSVKAALDSAPLQRRKEVRDVLASKLQSGMHVNDFENYCETIKSDLIFKREISDTASQEEKYLTNLLCMGLTAEQQKDIQESVVNIRFAQRLEVLRNTLLLTTAAATFNQKILVLASFANICSNPVNLQELLEDFLPLVNPKNIDSYPSILNKFVTMTRDQRKDFVTEFLASPKVPEVVLKDPRIHV